MRIFILLCFLVLVRYAAAQQAIDVQHYRFELELSDQSDAITGRSLVDVKFLKDAAQLDLDLATIENDKGFVAYTVKSEGQMLRTHHANDVLSIFLNQPAKAGEQRSFEIDYMGTPKDGLIISRNKYGDRSFFADNWPNRAHQWIPCNDRPDDKASFEFLITAPDHYKVISNGIKTGEENLADHKLRTHYREETALSTKVMVIGVARFAVKEFDDSPQGLPVSAWVYPQDSTRGFYDYAVAPSIVKFFSGYIAPFPYKKLANVQSKTIFGGMENAGAIFYAEGSVTGDRSWEAVLAHEIAHQWFGDMASEKSFAHLWLSEGFATYLTNIYIGDKYGGDSAIKRLQQERKEVWDFVQKTGHPVVDSSSDLMFLLNANSYQKGGWVLHMLRTQVGDTVFRKIIQSYYEQYKGGNADTRDFEAIAEKVSGRELTWFFDQWLYRPGIPQLQFSYNSKKHELSIEQKQNLIYRFPLALGFNSQGGKMTAKNYEIKDRKTIILVPAGTASVTIDPFTSLLYEGKHQVDLK